MGDIAPSVTVSEPNPRLSILDKVLALSRGGDNGYYNAFPFGKDVVMTNDLAKTYSIDHKTLETIASFVPDVPRGIPGFDYAFPSTTHPVPEYNTSNTLTFATSLVPAPPFFKWLGRATIVLYRAKSFDDREVVVEIPIDVDQIPAMHSFAASANYVILFAHPEYIDMIAILSNAYALPAIKWHPDKMTSVYVISLKTKGVIKLELPPIFFVHHVNSYEEGNKIITDYVIYDPVETGFMELYDLFLMENVWNRTKRNSVGVKNRLMRVTIDLELESIDIQRHTPIPGMANDLDFPVINENYRHRRACYVYGVIWKADGKNFATHVLAKKNLCESDQHDQDKTWFRKNHYLSEPRFIPRPGGDDEDDGILICIIMDGERGETYVGVFDPITMELMDKAYTPDVVNFNTHGNFFPDDWHYNTYIIH